jgi:hypothetical protein
MRHIGGKQTLGAALVAIFVLATASTAVADPHYEVMNAPEGVYWRSEPNWAAAERITGFGVYNGTIIEVHCYQSGTAVEGSADTMWEQATDVGGRGYGSGWLDEHFINDSQPINQPSPGVPPCNASPPPPPPPPPAGLVFSIFNAEGGIYYRNSPHWADTSAIPGVGVYNGDQVELICGAFGDPVGPFNDTAWSYVNNLSRPVGDGWVDEHFINDGAPDNAFVSDEPTCGSGTPGLSAGGGPGSPAPPPPPPPPPLIEYEPQDIYYSPYDEGSHELADKTLVKTVYEHQFATGCTSAQPAYQAALNLAGHAPIGTLAGWSKGRVGVMSFLSLANSGQLGQLEYILLIDPGTYGELTCDRQLQAGQHLAKWLAHNSSAHLVVISTTQVSQKENSRGIQESYFNAIRQQATSANNLRGRVLTCNYTMTHQAAFATAQYWIAHRIGTSVKSCPWLSGSGSTYKPTAGWHP